MDSAVTGPVPHLRRGAGHQVNGPSPVIHDPESEAGQRRRARRTAILLGILAVAIYLGFILSVGLRG